jgi:hypothetical protein
MALITLPFTAVNGETLSAANFNSDFTTIYNDYNGNITNANVSASAGITLGKLNLNPGGVAFNQQLTGNDAWCAGLTTDTDPSVGFTSDGWCFFGPGGATAFDVYLKRSAALTLQLVSTSSNPTLDMNSGTIKNATLPGASTTYSGTTALATATITTLTVTNAPTFTAPPTVPNGGTGAATFTAHGVMLGEGTSALSVTAAGAVNTALTGNGAADPTFQQLSYAIPQLRVYLVTGSPYADGSSSGNTAIFCGPLPTGDMVTWDNGSGVLTTTALTECTLSLTATSAHSYSVFLYNNSGTWTLEIDVWSGANTPLTYGTDALGRYAKSGATNKLLVAEFYASGSNTVYNWTGERSLCNIYNTISKSVFAQIPAASWTYGTATWRASDANTTNGQGRVGVFSSSVPNSINASFAQDMALGANNCWISIGIDSTSSPTAREASAFTNADGEVICSIVANYAGVLSPGIHYVQMMEYVQGTETFYGNGVAVGSGNAGSSALTGTIMQ